MLSHPSTPTAPQYSYDFITKLDTALKFLAAYQDVRRKRYGQVTADNHRARHTPSPTRRKWFEDKEKHEEWLFDNPPTPSESDQDKKPPVCLHTRKRKALVFSPSSLPTPQSQPQSADETSTESASPLILESRTVIDAVSQGKRKRPNDKTSLSENALCSSHVPLNSRLLRRSKRARVQNG